MKKRIIIEYGGISRIAKDFKTTRKSVYDALSYRSNSTKARLIRKVAVERGGVEIGDLKKAV
jgi:DNA-binding phage protein